MNKKINKIIIDTSVIVKWLSDDKEKDVKQAEKILDDLENNNLEVIVSELVYYELGNVLFWGKNLNKQQYCQTFETFLKLPLVVYPFSNRVINKALIIMQKYQLSFYDAVPLVIAELENCFLISADKKHHCGLSQVLPLKEYFF